MVFPTEFLQQEARVRGKKNLADMNHGERLSGDPDVDVKSTIALKRIKATNVASVIRSVEPLISVCTDDKSTAVFRIFTFLAPSSSQSEDNNARAGETRWVNSYSCTITIQE